MGAVAEAKEKVLIRDRIVIELVDCAIENTIPDSAWWKGSRYRKTPTCIKYKENVHSSNK